MIVHEGSSAYQFLESVVDRKFATTDVAISIIMIRAYSRPQHVFYSSFLFGHQIENGKDD